MESIDVLCERMQNYKDQVLHLIALYESEQRTISNISKRVDGDDYRIKNIDELIKKHEKILLNEGRGLSYEVDRLKRLQENKKSALVTWISVLSLLTSIVAIVLMILK